MVVLRGLFCALLLVIPSLALSATPYPLWAISEGDNTFSQQDYKVLAENFIFAHGDFTSAQLNALKAVNPDFIKLKYINTSKTNTPADAIAAETNARTSILHHRIATLTATIDAAQTSFVLSAVAGATLALKPSTAPGNYSVQSDSAQSYVTWLRIGDEFMRVNGWDSGTKTVTVTRGFDGTTAVAHAAGDAVCSPTYCVPNYPGGASPLRYQMDPAGPLRWNTSLAAAVSHKDSGFDGTWYDILGSAPFQPLDINGNDPNDWWDFTKNSNYSRDDFRLYSEMGIHSVQTGFHSQKGVWPIIFGNNMIASSYEVGSGGRKLFLESTAQKPRPIDGYCIESYAFHIEEDDFQQWRQDGSLAPPKFEGYSSWKQNVQMLMKASQAGLAAAPAMMNAGWKTMMFERYPDDLKDRFETYAYASYLIAAHKNGDDCSTPFGTIPFKWVGSTRQAFLHGRYLWPIGNPEQTVAPANVDNYRPSGHDSYVRRFTGGIVVVNPTATADNNVPLGAVYRDMETGSEVLAVDMPAQTGKILLKKTAARTGILYGE